MSKIKSEQIENLKNKIKPLCIDCDGTLINADLLHESLVRIILNNPGTIFLVVFWTIQGRAHLKSKLAHHIQPDISLLPFRDEVLHFARERKTLGGKVLLATASNGVLAQKIADHCGVFDEVLASDELTNFKGKTKKLYLVERFGEKGFDYAGDSFSDLLVWASAHTAIVIGRSRSFAMRVRKVNSNILHLKSEPRSARSWLKLIRVHQWAKNLIIFVPLVTSHRIFEVSHLTQAIAAFVSFSLLASATYIFNDLCDLDNDRAHASKRRRPLADGSISLPAAVVAVFLLGAAAVATGFSLGLGFLLVLAVYLFVSMFYSSFLKKSALIDVIVLSGLYIWRLVAGGVATGILLSNWLLSFALFIFMSLALAKRYVEISDLSCKKFDKSSISPGRGYLASDIHLVFALGVSSAMVSVLVVLVYVSSPDVIVLYKHPQVLFLLAPLVLFWISRIWLLASRGALNEDPVLFAVKDKCSYAVVACIIAILIASVLGIL
jgi:4-hydroxybenzoate polyprenyltransferase